jgi:hypothetical protein
MMNLQHIEIRPAKQSELSKCADLNNRSILGDDATPCSGFLLTKLSEEQMASYNTDGILRVALIQNQLVGFILAFKRGSKFFSGLLPLMDNVEWNDPSILSIKELLYVYKKVVEPSFRRQGIASTMYQAIQNEFYDFGLLGATIEKPVLYKPSKQFRERRQYRKVGTFRADEFEGIKNYQCGIYFKSGS